MLKRMLIGVFWLHSMFSTEAQFAPKSYGGSGADRGVGITRTTKNDGYVIAGFTTSFDVSGEDIYVVKTDLNGNLIWEKTYGGTGDDNVWSIQKNRNGNYMLVGFSNSYSKGDWDIFLLEIDEEGREIWSSNLAMPGDQYAWDILVDSEDNYIIVGQTKNNENGKETSLCLKLNLKGERVWAYQSAATEMNRAFGVIQLDEAYFISGLTATDSAGFDGFVTRISEAGNEVWTHLYGGSNNDLFHAVNESHDGNIILSGYSKSYGQGNNSPWLLKVDLRGQQIWSNVIGSRLEERIVSATVAENGEISLLGYVLKTSNVDLLRVQLDSHGQLLSLNTFGSSQNEEAGQTMVISDNQIIYSGRSYQHDHANGDLIVVMEEF